MCAASQRIDLLQPEQVGPGLGSMSPTRRRSNRRCRTVFATPVTEKTAAFHVHRICQSSWKGLDMGRHKMSSVQCPCSRLVALNGAPQTFLLLIHGT